MEIHEKFCNPHLFSFSDFQLQFVYAYFTYAATLSTYTDDVTKMVMYRKFNTNCFTGILSEKSGLSLTSFKNFY